MWNRKANRIADLEARNAILLQQLDEVRSECDSWKWAAKSRNFSADTALITRTRERDQHRRRLSRALYACARYRAQLAQQQPVIDALTEQLFNAIDYTPEQRRLLDFPTPEVTA